MAGDPSREQPAKVRRIEPQSRSVCRRASKAILSAVEQTEVRPVIGVVIYVIGPGARGVEVSGVIGKVPPEVILLNRKGLLDLGIIQVGAEDTVTIVFIVGGVWRSGVVLVRRRA